MLDSLKVGDWEFLLDVANGKHFLSVPDCGGMADSVPRKPEQLAWAERELAALPWLVQVWPTAWEFPADRLAERRAFFAKATR